MLKKEYRLGKVFLTHSKTLSAPFFTLKTSKNDMQVSRFAFVVSKKIDKRATGRNELRRKIRSCIEEIFDTIKPGQDFVFYPKQSAVQASRDQILKEVQNIFKESGFIND